MRAQRATAGPLRSEEQLATKTRSRTFPDAASGSKLEAQAGLALRAPAANDITTSNLNTCAFAASVHSRFSV